MNAGELQTRVLTALHTIAPEVELSAVPRGADLRDAADLDSMDFLRFIVALQSSVGVTIPEADYPQVRSLGALLAYLEARAP